MNKIKDLQRYLRAHAFLREDFEQQGMGYAAVDEMRPGGGRREGDQEPADDVDSRR